jgi:hypothetical protein
MTQKKTRHVTNMNIDDMTRLHSVKTNLTLLNQKPIRACTELTSKFNCKVLRPVEGFLQEGKIPFFRGFVNPGRQKIAHK